MHKIIRRMFFFLECPPFMSQPNGKVKVLLKRQEKKHLFSRKDHSDHREVKEKFQIVLKDLFIDENRFKFNS